MSQSRIVYFVSNEKADLDRNYDIISFDITINTIERSINRSAQKLLSKDRLNGFKFDMVFDFDYHLVFEKIGWEFWQSKFKWTTNSEWSHCFGKAFESMIFALKSVLVKILFEIRIRHLFIAKVVRIEAIVSMYSKS